MTTPDRQAAGRFSGVGALAALLAVTFLAAGVGAVASASAPQFYEALMRPAWAPAPGVFGPVWSVLYTLIAVAAYLVVREVGWHSARTPLLLYGLQLVLNALWTWLFFEWTSGAAAFVDIVMLLILVALMMWSFWRVRPLAGMLIAPYLAWVGFATLLTWSVWQLNPAAL